MMKQKIALPGWWVVFWNMSFNLKDPRAGKNRPSSLMEQQQNPYDIPLYWLVAIPKICTLED